MNIEKTLYISDLDGTLLNKSAKLSEYTIKTLNSMIENGLNFSVATARLLNPVEKMLEDVNISVPIILMNGVLIYDMNKESYVKVNKLQQDTTNMIIETIKSFKVKSFMYELNDAKLTIYHEIFDQNLLSDYVKERIIRYNSVNGFPKETTENIIYFTLMDTYERLKPIYDILSNKSGINQTLYENIYSTDLWYLEIFSDQASKKTAVDHLRNLYEFDYVVGFGDNHNDLPLFEACDMCVAVGNATEELQKKADYICENNNSDGVIKWLEDNINK